MPERDLIGYGATPPSVRWPNDARIAVSLVVNYEEGSELDLVRPGQFEIASECGPTWSLDFCAAWGAP
jgi:hypothetical protein